MPDPFSGGMIDSVGYRGSHPCDTNFADTPGANGRDYRIRLLQKFHFKFRHIRVVPRCFCLACLPVIALACEVRSKGDALREDRLSTTR